MLICCNFLASIAERVTIVDIMSWWLYWLNHTQSLDELLLKDKLQLAYETYDGLKKF